MASSGGREGQSALDCSICFDLLDNALETGCGHAYCSKCLEDLINQSSAAPQCPLCRQPVVSIHRSFSLRNAVDTERSRRNLSCTPSEEALQAEQRLLSRFASSQSHHTGGLIASARGEEGLLLQILAFVLIFAALAYLVLPVDVIPDFLGPEALIDDVIIAIWLYIVFRAARETILARRPT